MPLDREIYMIESYVLTSKNSTVDKIHISTNLSCVQTSIIIDYSEIGCILATEIAVGEIQIKWCYCYRSATISTPIAARLS